MKSGIGVECFRHSKAKDSFVLSVLFGSLTNESSLNILENAIAGWLAEHTTKKCRHNFNLSGSNYSTFAGMLDDVASCASDK